jgi:hypothetical protein
MNKRSKGRLKLYPPLTSILFGLSSFHKIFLISLGVIF